MFRAWDDYGRSGDRIWGAGLAETEKYRAPALQKGLEILELLAPSARPMSTADISSAMGRSISEIFRMLQVLEAQGYISRSGEGFRITNRLFTLGMAQPPIRDLLEQALPAMRALAERLQQSCHLAMRSGDEMVVVANVQSPGLLGFAVRMGYRRPLVLSASGHVLVACQPVLDHAWVEAEASRRGLDAAVLLAALQAVAEAGHVAMASPMLNAITDLSAPVRQGGLTVAALTVPFVYGPGTTLDQDEARAALLAVTHDLSDAAAGAR